METVIDVDDRYQVDKRLQNVVATVAVQEDNLFQNEVGSKYYCGYVDGVLNRHYTLINCRDSLPGQFVQILMDVDQGVLNVYEVEVHGI